MERDEIVKHCGEPLGGLSDAAFNAFCAEMKDKQYGWDETRQAFFFFVSGWGACAEYLATYVPRA